MNISKAAKQMFGNRLRALRLAAALLLCGPAGIAAEPQPVLGQSGGPAEQRPWTDRIDLRLGTLFDVRAIRTDEAKSWYDGGQGRARYGGDGQNADELLRLSQASLFLSGATVNDFFGYVQVDIDGEPARRSRGPRLQATEAFIGNRFLLSPHLLLISKIGAFHAPISFEHEDPAWTPKYSLTPSAINSWLGEEMRTIGAESKLRYSYLSREAAVYGGVFAANDPLGSLLAWRGWTMGDWQSGLRQRLPLPEIPVLSKGGLFADQARSVRPFKELDDRPGLYAGLHLVDHRFLELRSFYYDNRGDRVTFDGGQYSWDTRFAAFGARVKPHRRFELVSQFLGGNTKMGVLPSGVIAVDNDFYSYYLLASYRAEQQRVSLRFDRFRVRDEDETGALGRNGEIGRAWTLAYFFTPSRPHRLGAELLYIQSARDVRPQIGLNAEEEEIIVQLSYRFVERDIFGRLAELLQ